MKKSACALAAALLCAVCAAQTPPALDLSGPWKARAGDSPAWKDPALDDSSWAEIRLPSANFLSRYREALFPGGAASRKTFIWFRREFSLERPPSGMRWLQVGEIQNADEVYLNGVRIGSTGGFPPDFHSGWRSFRSYPIDPAILRAGGNVLSIRAFCDGEDWIMGPLRITADPAANRVKMMQDFWRINIFEYFYILLVWVAAYFSIYWFKRRAEQEYLYFSLTCAMLALILLVWFYDVKYPFIPIPSNSIYALSQAALFFFPPLLSLFVYSFLNRHVGVRRLILSLAGPAAGTAVLLASTERTWLLGVRSVFMALMPVFIAVIYADLYRALRARKKRAAPLAFGVVPLTLFSVRDILAFAFGIGTDGNAWFVYGIPPFFFLFAFQFIQQFVNNLNRMERLKTSFHRFVPVEFLSMIGRPTIEEVRLGDSARRELSILFTDIRQFTGISETLDPQRVFSFLNSYLSHMVPVVRSHSGYVDKYIGDAIMALFPRGPRDAVAAAAAMHRALRAFNAEQAALGMGPVCASTGIHHGALVLGTIGGEDRMEGTVIADSVNLASRIESLTRYYGCDIVCSGSVMAASPVPEGALSRFIDRVSVAGRSSIVELHEILWDPASPAQRLRAQGVPLFAQATAHYYRGQLEDAERCFREAADCDPDDGVAAVYLKRLEQIRSGVAEWKDHTAFSRK